MTDYSRDRLGPDDEDRLPWLEPVEEEYDDAGGGATRMLIVIAVALVLLGVILGGFLWLRGRDGPSSGNGALIEAPDSYYKERPPADPVAAEGDEIVYSASKGNEVQSVIDTSRAAEAPVNVDRAPIASPISKPAIAPAKPAPAAKPTVAPAPAAPAAETVVAVAAKPDPKPSAADPDPSVRASGGSTIQLGAFSSPAKANAAWKNLSGRFSFLSGLTSSVVPVQSGEKTLYRLRAAGGNAKDLCGRLRTAGESCSVVG